MNEQIESAIKGVRGYWFIEGFIEMVTGALFVLLAVPLLLRPQASTSSFSAWFLSTAAEISAVKIVGILAAVLVLWWLKDRFTYPRTGFVRGQRMTAAQILNVLRNALLFLLVPVLGLLGVSLLLTSWNTLLAAMPVWYPAGLGILWAILFWLSGGWMGISRFRIMAGLSFAAGAIIGAWQFMSGLPRFVSDSQPGLLQAALVECLTRTLWSIGLLVLICGVGLICSGFIAFLRYRKENPVPYSENA